MDFTNLPMGQFNYATFNQRIHVGGPFSLTECYISAGVSHFVFSAQSLGTLIYKLIYTPMFIRHLILRSNRLLDLVTVY